MNEKKLKKLYTAYAEASAPDMDALWERIEGGLDGKSGGVTSKPIRRKISIAKITAFGAAAAAVLIIIPVAFTGNNTKDMAAFDSAGGASNGAYMMDGAAAEVNTEAYKSENTEPADGAAAETTAEENGYDDDIAEVVCESAPVDALQHQDAENGDDDSEQGIVGCGIIDDEYNSEPHDYAAEAAFDEEEILAQTDVIFIAHVEKYHFRCENGEVTHFLDITAENAETGETESFTLENTSHPVGIGYMSEGDTYILPLKKTDGGYRIIDDNAAYMIRILEKQGGELMFQESWKCLENGNSRPADTLIKSGMRISDTASAQMLIDRWHDIKNGG